MKQLSIKGNADHDDRPVVRFLPGMAAAASAGEPISHRLGTRHFPPAGRDFLQRQRWP